MDVSSLIYVLNHIHRLDQGLETYVYLFALGLFFALPYWISKNIWFTGGIHWAGNCFFFFIHEMGEVKENLSWISPNYTLVLASVLLMPLNYLLIQRLRK